MNNFKFSMMTQLDRHVVNNHIINSKDKDIKDIIFDCYSNLRSTIVVAWNYKLADSKTMFESEFKEQIRKVKEYEFSVDVNNLDNIYGQFEFLYIIDPEHVADKYRKDSVKNTIEQFRAAVEGYDNVNWNILSYLQKILEKEERILDKAKAIYDKEGPAVLAKRGRRKKGEEDTLTTEEKRLSSLYIKYLQLSQADMEASLFVPKQTILVPEIDKNNKYYIDGINYYGVYNNINTGKLTKSRTLGYKIFKGGRTNTAYFGITKDPDFGDVLYVSIYGAMHNPYHLLTRENMEDIENYDDLIVFNKTRNNPRWDKLIYNTFQKALFMDMNPKMFTLDLDRKGIGEIYNEKKMHFPELKHRALGRESRYKKDINIGLLSMLMKLEHLVIGNTEYAEEIRGNTFTQLAALEETILNRINSENKIPKALSPVKGVRRINLNPMLLRSVIKKNSDENADTLLFKDNKKEPNPFDIFNIFAYAQLTNHTQTTENKHVSSKAKNTGEDSNWIKWKTLPYLSIYFSKNNVPLGKNNILHFSIDDKHIIERGKSKEAFKDIYDSDL